MTRTLDILPLSARLPTDRPAAGPPASALAAAAVVLLGLATSVNYGQYAPAALTWLAAAVAATLLAVRWSGASARADGLPTTAASSNKVFWAGLVAAQFAHFAARHPTIPELAGDAGLPLVRASAAVVAIAAVVGLFAAPRFKVLCVAAMLAGYLAAGATILAAHPTPGVDVITFQRDACDAVLAGRSPYGLTFPDESPAGTALYAAGVVVGGRLQFGFPYPPLSLLLVLPAHAAGDFRYAGLLATAAAAGLIALASRGPRAVAAAGLLLLTPTGLFVVWAGWTEPLVLMFLAATVYAAGRSAVARRPADPASPARPAPISSPAARTSGVPLLAIALGLLLASKQYAVLLLPLVPLLVPAGQRARTAVFALIVAAAVTLPMALWDPGAFLHSAVLLQFRQPFRADALSFLAPLHGTLPHAAAAAVPFALTLAVTVWVLKACPRTPAGFAVAAAAVLLVFFALNKQAFCNYYHLVIGALCCAATTTAAADGEPQMDTDEHR